MLTIAGCPVVFTSPGIGDVSSMSSLPISHGDWPYGISQITQIANGALDPKSIGDFSEEIDLLNGNFNADGITFRIHDILMSYEGETVNIASKLFTSKNQETCQLASTFTAEDDTGTLTIFGDNMVADSLGFIWVNGEAMEKDSISGNVVNVTYRAALGTSRKSHKVDIHSNYRSTVYLSYPGPYKQKVLLWRRDEAGTWSVIWRGIGGRAPRASGNGAPIELQCEHLWTDFRGRNYDLVEAKTKLTGWDSRKITFNKYTETALAGLFNPPASPPPDRFYQTPSMLNIEYNERGFASIYAYGIWQAFNQYIGTGQFFENWRASRGLASALQDGKFAVVLPAGSGDGFRLEIVITSGGSAPSIDSRAFRSFGVSPAPVAGAAELPDGSSGKVLNAPIQEMSALQVFRNGALASEDNHLFVDRVNSLEKFDIVNSGSINTCWTRTTWIGDIDAETYRKPEATVGTNFAEAVSDSTVLTPGAPRGDAHGERTMLYYCSANSYDWDKQYIPTTSGPAREPLFFASGSATFRPKNIAKVYGDRSEAWRQVHFVTQEVDLEHRMSLKSKHWMDLLRYGIIEKFHYEKDFNFSFPYYQLLKLTNQSMTTELLLEPKTSLGDITQNITQFYGIAPTTTDEGKMRFVKIEKPVISTSSSWTLTSNDYIKSEKPQWEDVGDNVVTAVIVKSDGLAGGNGMLVRNQEARGKHGECQTIEIDLSKLGIEFALFQKSPQEVITFLTTEVTSRFFTLFSDPYTAYTIHLPLSYMTRIYPGMVITVSDWLLPNGSGGRGLSSAKLLVQKKVTSIQTGKVSITAILFPGEANTGFSPCVKLSSINVATKTLTVTGSYISTGITSSQSPTDYAGSNLSGYSSTNGSANDRGIGWFNVGDKIQLLLRDTATWAYDSFTIASIGSNTIVVSETITTGAVNWPVFAASGSVDVRFSPYSTTGLQEGQKAWAYIGDGPTRRIASTAKIKRFR